MPTTQQLRRGQLIQRALIIIDVMAPYRNGKTSTEWTHLVNERIGATYCKRTIHRDLLAMVDIGLVDLDIQICAGKRPRYVFTLYLRPSETGQRAAIKMASYE